MLDDVGRDLRRRRIGPWKLPGLREEQTANRRYGETEHADEANELRPIVQASQDGRDFRALSSTRLGRKVQFE